MKIKKPKRIMSLFLAALMCVTSLVGIGTTAYAAEETDDVYLISYPRDGDSNYNAEWGHGSLTFMNGWKTGTSRYTTVRAMGSYNGNICYCIEIGVPQQTGDSFTKKGEDFWDNYPASYNSTISPDDIKLFIGRIFQYGYTGTISTSWRSQNEGGDKLAHAVATQLLIWETVIGERDENFNKVSTGGKDAVLDQISRNHPLYDKIMSYYNSMAASVQKHSKLPSFLSKTPGSAQEIELKWDGSKYTVTLTDSNNVLSGYKFSSNNSGVQFSVSGNKLTITAEKAPSDGLTITAEKTAQRKGVITWTDGIYGPNGGVQDTVTYAQTVNDPVKGFLKLKVSYGSAKIVKTSEDGKVDGISFRIQGNGIDKTVKTENGGQIQVDTKLQDEKTSVSYDVLEMSGSRAVWKEVLAVYSVKVNTDPDNPQEVATMDESKKQLLTDIFWEMNEIRSSTDTKTETVITETDDGHGNIVETESTVTQTYLYITVSHKTADEMAAQYGFNEEQKEYLAELLADENNSLWSQVLYGITGTDDQIVTVALSQIGTMGGDPYWSWYGFNSRVEWCACFVSWCANECGYIDAGVIPKYAGCVNGVQWFKDRGQWLDNSAEPTPGMIIFFDWADESGQDGLSDHTGIVQKVENGRVYTVEGNSGDSVRQNSYPVGYYEILGYGAPAY